MTMTRYNLRRQLILPDVPTGAALNPLRGFFSVIVPVQRTNLVTNPSIETATTGYTAVGGSIAQNSTRSYYGAYSLAVTPTAAVNDGAYYAIALTASTLYAFSCRFWGIPGVRYKLSVASTAPADLVVVPFTGTSDWQWVYGYWNETASTTRRIYFTKNNSTSTGVFYVDGVQVEAISAGETVSTYIDGDQAGLLPGQVPYPYYWTGTPHASTSVRLATTRAGGMVMNLDKYLFTVLAFTGLGLTTVANVASAPASTDGSAYQTTIARSRSFAINGQWSAHTLRQLDASRSALYSAVGPDGAAPRQPSVLLYQAYDGLIPTSQEGRIVAAYDGGLEGKTDSPFRETAPISFTQYLPAIQAGEAGIALPAIATFTNANNIVQRSATGTWSAMGTGAAGATDGVRAFAFGLDKTVYAGGDFTGMGGVANTSRIAKWDGSVWTALGTGALNGTVYALAIGPDGSLYAAGTFTQMGGVANTARIAKWNGSVWTALGTGADGSVFALVFGPDGTLYVGGGFTHLGGVAATRVGKWDGSNWSALGAGAGADAGVQALVIGKDGYLYAGGYFTTMDAITVNGTARWNGSAWSAMGTGLAGGAEAVLAMAVGPDGRIYAGGNYVTAGYINAWTGGGWTRLGALNNFVLSMTFGPDGLLYTGGVFTQDGTFVFGDGFAAWNGSSWVASDVALPGTAGVYGVGAAPTGELYVGFDTTGSGGGPAVTTVTNNGTARSYPTITTVAAVNASQILSLKNYTNGRAIYFNYTITAGETLTIRCSSQGTTIISNYRGDISYVVMPGSSQDFPLEKGANLISFFQGKTTAVLRFPNNYQSVADLAYH